MSNSSYNPYISGNQRSDQGQYAGSTFPTGSHPHGGSSHVRPESSFSSASAFPVAAQSSDRMFPSTMSQSVAYRPDQGRAGINEDMGRSVDMHVSRFSEEMRHYGKPTYQFMDQNTGFASSQREEFRSPGTDGDHFRSLDTGRSYSVSSSSTPVGQTYSNFESGSSSLDWLSKYEKPSSSSSGFYSSSVSSTYASSGEGFSAPSKREHNQQSNSSFRESSVAYAESTNQKYNSQSAANILLHFGLEKEDLEQLISYPEEELTPDNLPFILRQIRIQKNKREAAADQPKPLLEPQPIRSIVGMNRNDLYTARGIGNLQEGRSTIVPQTSNVIDYGHASRYTRDVANDFRRPSNNVASSSGRVLPVDNSMSFKQEQEDLQNDAPGKKSSVGGFTQDQASSSANLSNLFQSMVKPVTPSSKATPSLQTMLGSASLGKQSMDLRAVQSEIRQPVSSAEPKTDQQLASKAHTSLPAVNQVRPGFVLYDSKKGSGTKTEVNTPAQSSSVPKETKKPQEETQMPKQPLVQQQVRKQVEQTGKPLPPADTVAWTFPFPSVKPAPPAPAAVEISDISQTVKYPAFLPGAPQPTASPPVQAQPVASLTSYYNLTPTSSHKPAETGPASKGLPDLALINDYAAATPTVFPHTCSLCLKECKQMRVSRKTVLGSLLCMN